MVQLKLKKSSSDQSKNAKKNTDGEGGNLFTNKFKNSFLVM